MSERLFDETQIDSGSDCCSSHEGVQMTRCNVCGRYLDVFDAHTGISISKPLGYGSAFDGNVLNLHICCDCSDKIIQSCKISPVFTEV